MNVLLMFMYIFGFKIYGIFDSTLLVGVSLFSFFLFRKKFRKFFLDTLTEFKNVITYLLIFLLIFTFLILFSTVIINQIYDFSYLKVMIHLIINIFIGIALFIYYKSKNSVSNILNYIIISFIIQSCLQFFFFLFPVISGFFNIFRTQAMINLGNKYHNIRGLAISSFGFFGLSSAYALVMILYFSKYNTLFKNKILKIMCFLIIIIGTFFAGRIGFVSLLFLPFILYSFIKSYIEKRAKKIFIDIFVIVVVAICSGFILLKLPRVKTLFNYSFELFNNVLSGKGFYTTSTNKLLEMYDVEISLKTFFIGDGQYTVKTSEGNLYYQDTDVGYLRKILLFGIVGLIVSIIFQYYLMNKNIKGKINISIILLMLILELKGEIIGISIIFNSIIFIYYLMIYFIEKEEKNKLEILNNDNKKTQKNDCSKYVSIIIPIYNSEKFILKTVNSILNQTYSNFELILVDDGSKDKTREILKKQFRNNSKIKILFQENSGAPIARNNGLKLAKGEYIIFFDSDDIMGEKYLENALNDDRDYDLIISAFEKRYIEEDKIENWHFKYKSNLNLCESLYFVPPFPNNKIYRRDIIVNNDIVFDNVKIAQDLNFYLKYLQYVNEVKIVDDINIYYQYHLNSVSTTYNMNLLDVEKSINLIESKLDKNIVNSNLIKMIRLQHYTTQLLKMKNYSKDDQIKIKKYFKKNIKKNDIYNLDAKYKKAIWKCIIYFKITMILPLNLNIIFNKIVRSVLHSESKI